MQCKDHVVMNKPLELNRLMDSPAARRLWMLYNALGSLPFDRAIEMARAAEAFVVGMEPDNSVAETVANGAQPHPDGRETIEEIQAALRSNVSVGTEPAATKRHALALSEEQRVRLLARLAEGAKNSELAAEFDLTAKQVQGFRMGCAREIAERRVRYATDAAFVDQEPANTTPVEEIIRYLRQQDDVVVPQEDGSYLVNARFRMSPSELTNRANRMRTRQRKPVFQLPLVKSHPVFWHSPTSTPASNGSQQPD
jgi:hypothetical protein